MPELTAILLAKRESEYQERKFLAALQGVDLEGSEPKKDGGQKEWEDMKSRVFSNGSANNSDDITSLQGQNAAKAGFGIGSGLEYQITKDAKNPFG